ncbi:hypothetical protein BIZ83_gp141 [Erwinia phage vB_EamM_ChrisDB]|uniref:hypothetical protein n=1 Tax=Erwinia phage vB_EamM_ChrisDB TaxID=1883371 RepID=UPI00081CAD37|nr:hypothetical protein BIZ83_gp141 [Erwinia phage vB_EamM_ChrisDB]ANZ48712.1 hypothetical protein CHRISDB_150 [Erwinia phage vB_EamM_ChrisDB]
MSVKQRKLRAAKRAHHAKKSKQERVQYNLSRVGINAHLDAGKLSTMDRILAPGASLSLNPPPSIQDIEGLLHTSNMHAITRALEELDVGYVKPKRRDEVIKAVSYALERDDFDDLDDLANHSILQLQLGRLTHQGEIVLVDAMTGFPPPSQAIEMIVLQARAVWEKSEEKLITPTTDNIVDWLITFGQKICKVKIQDYLGILNTGTPRGWFDDIDPEMFSRIRALAGNTTFFPHFPQMQADVPNPGDLVIDMEDNVGEGIFKIIKGRIGELGDERFVIDSLSGLVPDALKDIDVGEPKKSPYGNIFLTTPKGKDDA